MLQPQPKPYCSHAIQRERAAAAQVERGDGVARVGEQAHCSVGDGDETSKVEARYPRLLFGQPPLVRSDEVVQALVADAAAGAQVEHLQAQQPLAYVSDVKVSDVTAATQMQLQQLLACSQGLWQ